MVVLEVRKGRYEEISLRYHLQHYSGTTRTIEIQLCLCVYRQIYCDKIS